MYNNTMRDVPCVQAFLLVVVTWMRLEMEIHNSPLRCFVCFTVVLSFG